MIKSGLLTILVLLATLNLQAQDLQQLEERYGFKDIKLETHINNYPNLEPGKLHHSEKQEGIAAFQAIKGAYGKIGEIKVHEVHVLTYDSMIYEITVITEKNANLYKGLEKAFGKPQNKIGYGSYTWKTDNLSLTFRSHSKSKLELRYHAFAFKRWLKEEKEGKIEQVSSDF